MIIQCGELFLLLSYTQNRFILGEWFWVFRFILGEQFWAARICLGPELCGQLRGLWKYPGSSVGVLPEGCVLQAKPRGVASQVRC